MCCLSLCFSIPSYRRLLTFTLISLYLDPPSTQASFEGGFAGRTNKLVDGCYAYWQGAILPLLAEAGLYTAEASRRVAALRPSPEQEAAAADALVSHLHLRLQTMEDGAAKVWGVGFAIGRQGGGAFARALGRQRVGCGCQNSAQAP